MHPGLIYVGLGLAAGLAGWLFSKGEDKGNDTVSNNDGDGGRGAAGDQLHSRASASGGRKGRVKPGGPVPRKVTTIKEYQNDEVSPNDESGAAIRADKSRSGGDSEPDTSAEHAQTVRVEGDGDGDGDGDEVDEPTGGQEDA